MDVGEENRLDRRREDKGRDRTRESDKEREPHVIQRLISFQ